MNVTQKKVIKLTGMSSVTQPCVTSNGCVTNRKSFNINNVTLVTPLFLYRGYIIYIHTGKCVRALYRKMPLQPLHPLQI